MDWKTSSYRIDITVPGTSPLTVEMAENPQRDEAELRRHAKILADMFYRQMTEPLIIAEPGST